MCVLLVTLTECFWGQERKMVERSLVDLQSRLTELQQEKIAIEDSFGLQVAQLNERLLSEQRDKEKLEFNLRRLLEEAKNEISNELHTIFVCVNLLAWLFVFSSCFGTSKGRISSRATNEGRGAYKAVSC